MTRKNAISIFLEKNHAVPPHRDFDDTSKVSLLRDEVGESDEVDDGNGGLVVRFWGEWKQFLEAGGAGQRYRDGKSETKLRRL